MKTVVRPSRAKVKAQRKPTREEIFVRCVGHVIDAARVRGDPAVPRKYVVEALEQIKSGKVLVERYPSGMPFLKPTYQLAIQLSNE